MKGLGKFNAKRISGLRCLRTDEDLLMHREQSKQINK